MGHEPRRGSASRCRVTSARFRCFISLDLVHTADDYTDAVPVLVTMLNQTADYDVKEGIVRALSLKRFRSSAFGALVSALEDLFDDMSPRADTLKWAIGNALSVQATKEDGQDLRDLPAEHQ